MRAPRTGAARAHAKTRKERKPEAGSGISAVVSASGLLGARAGVVPVIVAFDRGLYLRLESLAGRQGRAPEEVIEHLVESGLREMDE
jgi:hypothetical protein